MKKIPTGPVVKEQGYINPAMKKKFEEIKARKKNKEKK